MGNEPILALPEGADDFVVYYDARSKDLVLGKREKVIACTSRQLKVLKKDCMTNVVTVLWAITGDSELNRSEFVLRNNQQKIWVIQERLEAAKLSKELACFLLESFGKLSKDPMSTPTQCCDMGSDGYAYPVYDMFGIVDPNMQNEILVSHNLKGRKMQWTEHESAEWEIPVGSCNQDKLQDATPHFTKLLLQF
ncbi:hypothetical protein Tco_0543863 [Tanacetum coccineum]